MIRRTEHRIERLDKETTDDPHYMHDSPEERHGPPAAGTEPNVMSSVVDVEWNDWRSEFALHAPVLDLDFPVVVVPSSTPGRYHLFLERPIEWEQYRPLLEAFAEAGLVERGYVEASIERRATYVRLPHVLKPAAAAEQRAMLERAGRMGCLPVPPPPGVPAMDLAEEPF